MISADAMNKLLIQSLFEVKYTLCAYSLLASLYISQTHYIERHTKHSVIEDSRRKREIQHNFVLLHIDNK